MKLSEWTDKMLEAELRYQAHIGICTVSACKECGARLAAAATAPTASARNWNGERMERKNNMAHTCPDCGMTCHCGGDIDDINFGDETDEALRCTHCEDEPLDRFESDEPYDEDPDNECAFPGECLMPGDHLRSECHTAEMVEEFNEQYMGFQIEPGAVATLDSSEKWGGEVAMWVPEDDTSVNWPEAKPIEETK